MSEENNGSKVEAKSVGDPSSEPSVDETTKDKAIKTSEINPSHEAAKKSMMFAKAAEEAEAIAKEALAKAKAAKAEAEKAAEEEYKAIAAEVKADTAKAPDYTFKRQSEEIFRRDMGEPEFFLDKKDRFPRPILTQDEQESLTRKAEIPHDQTPVYIPEHVLSPEFGGISNYEHSVNSFIGEARQRLEKLKNDPEATTKQIQDAENDVTYLESIHENFFIGMNVFRTAKGGRDKIKA